MAKTPNETQEQLLPNDKPAFIDTPEFQKAVADVAAQGIEKLKGEIQASLDAARNGTPAASSSGDNAWMQTLAMMIGQLTDQGTGRKRVAPELIKARDDARKRMVDLLVAARAEGKVASYRLRNKVLLDEQLIDPVWIDRNHTAQPTEIDWPGVPNEAMIPINETAKGIHAAFIESIGSVAREHNVPMDPLKITKGGLVVRGQASRAARETTLEAIHNPSGGHGEGVNIKHKNEPGRFREVRVLGTIAAPAQESV